MVWYRFPVSLARPHARWDYRDIIRMCPFGLPVDYQPWKENLLSNTDPLIRRLEALYQAITGARARGRLVFTRFRWKR